MPTAKQRLQHVSHVPEHGDTMLPLHVVPSSESHEVMTGFHILVVTSSWVQGPMSSLEAQPESNALEK